METPGTVVGIYITPEAGAPMRAVAAVRAVPGCGLEGDRYFGGEGSASKRPGPHRELTLIEAEALEALAAETGLVLPPEGCRRNVVTRGVRLNDLVGREFQVGSVRVRGIELCEPCSYLERLTAMPGLRRGLVHRGGLRACILTEGTLATGDAVQTVPLAP